MSKRVPGLDSEPGDKPAVRPPQRLGRAQQLRQPRPADVPEQAHRMPDAHLAGAAHQVVVHRPEPDECHAEVSPAAQQYRQALQIDPKYANAHNNLGSILLAQGKRDEALREYREAVRLQPQSASGLENLSRALATAPDPSPRDVADAVDAAERAAALTSRRDARALDVLAAAYAAAGAFDRAQNAAAAALRLLPAEPHAAEIRQRLELYRQHRRYTAP